jgi:hypothetical protein
MSRPENHAPAGTTHPQTLNPNYFIFTPHGLSVTDLLY